MMFGCTRAFLGYHKSLRSLKGLTLPCLRRFLTFSIFLCLDSDALLTGEKGKSSDALLTGEKGKSSDAFLTRIGRSGVKKIKNERYFILPG